MADEASIRMTVDSAPAIAENQKYVQSATETFNILHQQSQKLGLDAKQELEWMTRKIDLMREENRLKTESAVNLAKDYSSSAGERSTRIQEIKAEDKGAEAQLKELNKITKQNYVEQRAAEQKAERFGQSFSRMIPGLLNADSAGGMMTSGVGGMTAGLGIAGTVAAILISKAVRGATTMEPAMRDYAILTGRTLRETQAEVGKLDTSTDTGIARLGIKPSEYYVTKAQLSRAGGGVMNEDALGIIASEKALGLSRQSTTNLLGVERYDKGTITNIERYFEGYLKTVTKSIAEQKSMLPELIQGFTTEATRVLRITGKVNTEAITTSMTTVGKLFGLKGEPLQNVYGTLVQGLQQSSNPQIQAMQYTAMERAMPKGTSFLQMQQAMENPMAHPGYMVELLKMAKQAAGGDKDMYTRSIFNLGLAPSLTMAGEMADKNINTKMFAEQEKTFKETPTGGYEKRAESLMGALEKATAAWAGGFEKSGFAGGTENLVTQLTTALNGIGGGLAKVEGAIEDFQTKQALAAAAANTKFDRTLHEILLAISLSHH